MKNIDIAFALSKKAHKEQKRKYTNEDYIVHPLKVYNLLKYVTSDKNILCAGLLHDVIEDSGLTHKDISDILNKDIANIVQEVTKDRYGNFNIKTKEGLMVKLADMLDNISNSKDITYINNKINFIKGDKQWKLI